MKLLNIGLAGNKIKNINLQDVIFVVMTTEQQRWYNLQAMDTNPLNFSLHKLLSLSFLTRAYIKNNNKINIRSTHVFG